MKGGKNRQPLGYTILEVMIVLAISGVMFLIAASFINGKQERTAFTAGVNDMASQIQDTLQQVTSGQFSDIPLNCTFVPGNVTVGGGTTGQGANGSCIFLGKLLRFKNNSANYSLSSIAAGRTSGDTTTSLGTIDPTIISELTTNQTVPQSLNVTGIKITPVSGAPITNTYYNFGFVQGLGSSYGGSFQSGAQTISLIYSPETTDADADIKNNLAYAQTIQLCLDDGTQTAKLVLGTTTSQFNVNVQRLDRGAACP